MNPRRRRIRRGRRAERAALRLVADRWINQKKRADTIRRLNEVGRPLGLAHAFWETSGKREVHLAFYERDLLSIDPERFVALMSNVPKRTRTVLHIVQSAAAAAFKWPGVAFDTRPKR